MAAVRPITIAGGGLAGLTLGIGLRRQAVPVAVWEAGGYPRHRVCGEFISGHGPQVLQRLDLLDLLETAEPFRATTALFVSGRNRSPVRPMPAPALCISRYDLDAALAGEFQRLGGELRLNSRWTESNPCPGVVRAIGRRARATEAGWRWFGLKAHVPRDGGAEVAADVEMHLSAGGYVGVNRINRGEVNVCGLFRARPGSIALESKAQLLRGQPGTALHERLGGARFEESSFCSVAGLSLSPQRAADRAECCIGDAVTMIPPVTGNGMSMALESAELAIAPLAAYSRGEITWGNAQQTIAQRCDAAFAERLAWARVLQWLMFSPILRTGLGALMLRSDFLWRLMFSRTR